MDGRARATMVMIGSQVNWSELPPELLSTIGGRLDSPIDALGFRSVCKSWRSSASPFHRLSNSHLPSPPKFPCPFGSGEDAFVSEDAIYRLAPFHHDPEPDASNSSSIPAAKACFVKVEHTRPGKYPLWIRRIDDSLPPIPKVLSLLDYRMVKIGQSNLLNYKNRHSSMVGVGKVIRYPDSAPISSGNCSIFVIYDGGKLGFARCGDQELTLVDDRVSDYNDLIVYGGRLYAVDGRGTVSWIDYASLKPTHFSPPSFGSGGRKHLVESDGELYVVDRYFEEKGLQQPVVDHMFHRQQLGVIHRCLRRINTTVRGRLAQGRTVGFRVYKLDQDWGRWVEVVDLGDQAFFLNDDVSFSVSASAFEGCKGNCIYFKDRYDGSLFGYAREGCVYNLVDGSIQKYRRQIPLCFSNQHLNGKLWVVQVDYSTKHPMQA